MSTVTLFIPSLFWPGGDAGVYLDLALPALTALMVRGQASDSACEDEENWLCRRFGVSRHNDLPVAPLRLLGEGGDPDTDFWLCADPVHLRVRNDGLILRPPESLEIAAWESAEMVDAFNRHFAANGLVFCAPHPQRWYLKVPGSPRLRTVNLAAAVGRDVNRLLPEGDERLRWLPIFNEAQMLLHAHPVNLAREQRGAEIVNSVWFWGGGTIPGTATAFQAVATDQALAIGLCKVAGIPTVPLQSATALADERQTLIVLQHAAAAAARGTAAWRDALHALERDWFAPLLVRLRSGMLDAAVIATVAVGRSHEWSITRSRSRRFWKRALPLETHAARLTPVDRPEHSR